MPIFIPVETALTTNNIYGDEVDLSNNPIENAPVKIRLIKPGVGVDPIVSVSALSMRTITDENGHWEIPIIPSSLIAPEAVIEVETPSFGVFRLQVPDGPGSYKAISLRSDSL